MTQLCLIFTLESTFSSVCSISSIRSSPLSYFPCFCCAFGMPENRCHFEFSSSLSSFFFEYGMMPIVPKMSVSNEVLIFLSMLELELKLGRTFTSSSQGFSLWSRITSKPNSSKHRCLFLDALFKLFASCDSTEINVLMIISST